MSTVALAQQHQWQMQTPGWWTRAEPQAGICQEADGKWWLYQDDSAPMSGTAKPYKALKLAILAAA